MKKWMQVVFAAALMAASAFGQSKAGLEQVLTLLDKAAANFKSVQTDFEWDQYQRVVDEHDIQSGVMFFERNGNNVDVSADIQKPEAKKLVYRGGDVQVYSYRTHQVTGYKASKNREEIESFLALGFGGRGHDLVKSFDVHYAGAETVGGRATYKLELTPKSQKVQGMFRQITLWIDQQTGMSVQQKALEGASDYRLAKYSNIRVNQKLPEDAFKLKGK